jgi:hypothetical protein
VRGRFGHAIVGSEPSIKPYPRPYHRAGGGFLGFVDAYCHAIQRSPESRPQVDLGAFFRPRLPCGNLAANQFRPRVRSDS